MEAYSLKPLGKQPDHTRSKTAAELPSTSLAQINEEVEWSSSYTNSRAFTPTPLIPKKQFMRKHCALFNLPSVLSSNPQIANFQHFLNKLKRFPEIFDMFINKASELNIISSHSIKAAEYYYRYIHFSNNDKFTKIIKSQTAPKEKIISSNRSKSSFDRDSAGSDYFHIYGSEAHKNLNNVFQGIQMKMSQHVAPPPPKERRFRPNSRKRKNIVPKRTVLNRSKPKLVQAFKNMCGMANSMLKSCRLTNYLFKQYLQKKFPQEIVDAMSKYFDFKSSNFEDFCVELDRFICAGDERHYSMCFDCFDFNKDRYICYQDTYTAIELRKEDIYDSDLIKIRKMFEMKKKGKIQVKRTESRKGGRRSSVISLASELSGYGDESEIKRVPNIHPDKPEAIILDEFFRIDFQGKPQILKIFFIYTCNYDIENCREVVTPVLKTRKQSEDIIFDIKLNTKNLDFDEDEPKAKYFFELDQAMGLFHISKTTDLLKKFDLLRDKSSPEFKTLSVQSMTENWPKLFGVKNDYISLRFYHYLAGPENFDITKSRFLRQIYLMNESELSQKLFSFYIYDQRADRKITPDEIHRMEQNLPPDSLIHKECMLIVNEFIASIFGRKLRPVPFVEFGYFNELIPESLFYKEFMRVVDTPIDELFNQKNESWEIV